MDHVTSRIRSTEHPQESPREGPGTEPQPPKDRMRRSFAKSLWMRGKPLAFRTMASGLGFVLRAWGESLDARASDYDLHGDPALSDFVGPVIYVMWHEYIFLPTIVRRGSNMTLLIGMHRDAEWLSEIAQSLGTSTVRGSSTRGGIRAILQYTREYRDSSLVITPDGPRGPRRVLSPGCIQLASLLKIPLVPVGCGFDAPYRHRSWDRFAVPRYGSRARMIVGPRINIPSRLGRDGVEYWRSHTENVLQKLTEVSESWAADGRPREGERALFFAPYKSAERRSTLGLLT